MAFERESRVLSKNMAIYTDLPIPKYIRILAKLHGFLTFSTTTKQKPVQSFVFKRIWPAIMLLFYMFAIYFHISEIIYTHGELFSKLELYMLCFSNLLLALVPISVAFMTIWRGDAFVKFYELLNMVDMEVSSLLH